MSRITLVWSGGVWEGLYIDGLLVEQGERITADALLFHLDKAGILQDGAEIQETTIGKGDYLPTELAHVLPDSIIHIP